MRRAEGNHWPQGFEVDRRSVLGVGSVMVAASWAGLSSTPAFAAAKNTVRYAIIDGRHPESVAFGATLNGQGVEVLDIAGGLTALWQNKLLPLWRGEKGTGSVVGLTSFGVYSCLAEQARGEGRKSSLLGRHFIDDASGMATHAFTVPADTLPLANAISQNATWPTGLADLATRCTSSSARCVTHVTGAATAQSINLLSWTIG